MIEVKGLKLASNIKVLYQLKQLKGLKTLQETYQLFENTSVDSMVDILRVSYNVANNTECSVEEFFNILSEHNIGFLMIAETFKSLVEDILFNGLTPEEIEDRKNQLMKLK